MLRKDRPRPGQLVGNLLQIWPALIHHDGERWAAGFGSLYRLQFGRKDVLVIADHELATAVLRDRTRAAGDDTIQAHLDKVLPVLYRRMLSIVPSWRWLKLPADRASRRPTAALLCLHHRAQPVSCRTSSSPAAIPCLSAARRPRLR